MALVSLTLAEPSPFAWARGPRSSFSLGHEPGVYALFLRAGSTLPRIEPGEQGLLYIGLAGNRKGLKGRCHFNARTRNHSPRKSLAVLLMNTLRLTPVLIPKPNSADTWGLDTASDEKLSAWMHNHLDLAVELCSDTDARETELVGSYAPPLNLTKCAQTTQHDMISAARAAVMADLQRRQTPPTEVERRDVSERRTLSSISGSEASAPFEPPSSFARQMVGSEVDTAEAIAARYDLNPKSYRQRLRDCIPWFRKPQEWTFDVGISEWRDMIAAAEKMTCQSK